MPLLEADSLRVSFAVAGDAKRRLRAVDGVSISIGVGEVVAVVGESGCGKTTLARALIGLVPLDAGRIEFEGQGIDTADAVSLDGLRRRVQMVFQDPFDSLNPRKSVLATLGQPLRNRRGLRGAAQRQEAVRLLELVGLVPGDAFSDRFPHQFSGGQRQRIGIARAIAVGPRLVIADEAVSALDISIRAQILTLLRRLKEELALSYLFITHDLGVVRSFADRTLVMYLGRVVESGPTEAMFRTPAHPYTAALIAACPIPDPALARGRSDAPLAGDVPSPIDPPTGCRFHTRCPIAREMCRAVEPPPVALTGGRAVACHFPLAS